MDGVHGTPRGSRTKDTMARHPFHEVVIFGVYNTQQARVLDGHDSRSITFDAALGALADAGVAIRDVDGVIGAHGSEFVYQARIGPVWRSMSGMGIPAIIEAAGAIANGLATTVLIAAGRRASTPSGRRPRRGPVPPNEFVAPFGMFTAAEFAFMARRHMHLYGTTPEAMATVAADHPQQRPRQPRGRLLRARAVHASRTSSTAAWSPTPSTSSTAR